MQLSGEMVSIKFHCLVCLCACAFMKLPEYMWICGHNHECGYESGCMYKDVGIGASFTGVGARG